MTVDVNLYTSGPGSATYTVVQDLDGMGATIRVTMTPDAGHKLTRLFGYYTNWLITSGDHAVVRVDNSYSATVQRTWSVEVDVRAPSDSQTVKLCACFDGEIPDIGEYYNLCVYGQIVGGGGSIEFDEDTFTDVPVGLSVSGKVTAVPDPGYRFVKWETGSGSEYTNNPHSWTFTGTEERDYTLTFYAYFEEIPEYDYEVNAAPAAGGTVNGRDHLAGTLREGEQLSLSATPATGYYFAGYYGWDDDLQDYRLLTTSRTHTLTVRRDWDIEARFVQAPYQTLYVKFDPPSAWHGSHGTVTLSSSSPQQSHSLSEDGSADIVMRPDAAGVTVRIAFTPAPGCRFVAFVIGGRRTTSNPASQSFRPEDNHTIIIQAVCDRLYHEPVNGDLIHNANNALIHCAI